MSAEAMLPECPQVKELNYVIYCADVIGSNVDTTSARLHHYKEHARALASSAATGSARGEISEDVVWSHAILEHFRETASEDGLTIYSVPRLAFVCESFADRLGRAHTGEQLNKRIPIRRAMNPIPGTSVI